MAPRWKSWKPGYRGRPPGDWRQFRLADRVAGLKHRKAELGRFGEGAALAEKLGLDFGLDLRRQPDNRFDENAIMVIGRWTARNKRWFGPTTEIAEQTQIGWIDRETAAHLALAGPEFPIAAEFYEMAVAKKPDPEMGFGVIVKIIILVPSYKDALWGQISRIICET